MPWYDYKCVNKKCKSYDDMIDKQASLDERDKMPCDKCGKILEYVFNPTANMNISGARGGSYDFKDNKPSKNILTKDDIKTDYLYKCINEDCEFFDTHITVTKSMLKSERKEKCKKCKKEMSRIYSYSFKWGKGSRPDSDRRKQQMIDASDRGDMVTMENLQKNYDSTSRFFHAEQKVNKKEKKSINKKAYEYKCVNKKCEGFSKSIDVYKTSDKVDKEEKCERCGEVMQKIFGFVGFKIN